MNKPKEFPDMSKHKKCPVCQTRSKRVGKTIEGAQYNCPKHGNFFVRSRE